jgi:two-component system NtrC family sensor kinase
MSGWPIGRRLIVGFLGLFLVSGVGVTAALMAARQATTALEQVSEKAEWGRRLSRVGSLVREFYIHQAHLALGLHPAHHRALARTAWADLQAAIGPHEKPGAPLAWLRSEADGLNALFEGQFLPALDAGHNEVAVHLHHEAVERVDRIVARLEVDLVRVDGDIVEAEQSAVAAADQAVMRSAVVLGVTALLALLVAVGVTRTIARPVERLRRAAAALVAGEASTVPTGFAPFGSDSPLGSRVLSHGPAEVRALGAALNEMLTALEVQRRARSEAETMAVLGRVSAGIAHEINNPLGVILGHARLIEQLPGPAAEDAAIIARETRLCQGIVQALLDYARPGALRSQPVELSELLAMVADRFDVQVEATPALTVLGDAVRLEQLLANLLQNARAFGSQVKLLACRESDGVSIEVLDDGPGVASEEVDRIFEPFRSARPGGIGLGLPIARSIAEAHGGMLVARPGPGGRFRLWLPELRR